MAEVNWGKKNKILDREEKASGKWREAGANKIEKEKKGKDSERGLEIARERKTEKGGKSTGLTCLLQSNLQSWLTKSYFPFLSSPFLNQTQMLLSITTNRC